MLKGLRFATYATASLVGIVPFAFVWSFAGGELGAGHWISVVTIAAGMAAFVLVLRRLVDGALRM